MIGQVIRDFEIVRELGLGGMGKVYEARDRMLGRRVAVKVVRPELSNDPVLAERFHKEAQALARLNHGNVTSVHSLFRHEEQLFLVMEFVEGESLETRLRERGGLPWREATELAGAVLDGLRHAHHNDIIHRDVKPANLYLPLDGGIKIMDFGIAYILGQGRLTKHGSVVGTLAYMSPEQVSGAELDPRTDLYSLGVVLYEMVTGRVPFRADSDFALMRAHLEQAPEAPRKLVPGLPSWLEAAIIRSLAKDPGERFGTAAEFAAELRRGLARTDETEASALAPPAAFPAPPPRASVPAVTAATAATAAVKLRRRRLLPLAALGLVAVAAAVLVLTLPRSEPAAGPAPADAAVAAPSPQDQEPRDESGGELSPATTPPADAQEAAADDTPASPPPEPPPPEPPPPVKPPPAPPAPPPPVLEPASRERPPEIDAAEEPLPPVAGPPTSLPESPPLRSPEEDESAPLRPFPPPVVREASPSPEPAAAEEQEPEVSPPPSKQQETEAIQETLAAYAAAMESLDAAAVKEIWPGTDQTKLEEIFSDLRSQEVDLRDCAIRIDGAAASASCQETVKVIAKRGFAIPAQTNVIVFKLVKRDESWIIVDRELPD